MNRSAHNMNTFVFCFDSNYAKYCAVALLSLLISNGNRIKVCFIYDSLVSACQISSLVTIARKYGIAYELIPVDCSKLTRFKTSHHFTQANYLRLLIPDLIRDENRVLYLDSDLIVTKSLDSLFDLDLGGYSFAGVFDSAGEETTNIKIIKKGTYINSGVLLMNLDKLRRDDFTFRILEIYDDLSDSLKWVDQCLINKYAENEKLILEDTWNYQVRSAQVSRLEWIEAQNSMGIFHFVGGTKPWHAWARSYVTNFWWGYANLLHIEGLEIIESKSVEHMLMQCDSLENDYKFQESCNLKSKIIQILKNKV